jgi:hypothetical protein
VEEMNNYDDWKLDNGDKGLSCDCCEDTIKNAKEACEGKGKLETICEHCADKMTYCDSCNKYGKDEEFSFGQDYCDDCAEFAADKYSDND